MNKVFVLLAVVIISISSCKNQCDPGLLPMNDKVYLNILNANGTSFIKYSGGNIPDSLKVINIATNAVLPRTMFYDSILTIEDFDKTNGATTNLKIMKGNYLKPDTVNVTIGNKDEEDQCGTIYNVTRFSQLKANGVVKCTTCSFNSAINVQR